jgi:hypothetical protein
MVLFPEKKQPRLILAALLVLAMMGTFTFAEVEFFRFGDFEDNGPISGGFFSPADYTIDCLAAAGALISKARGYSFPPLRNASLRSVAALGTQNAGIALSRLSLKTIENTHRFNIKSAILLKLRI